MLPKPGPTKEGDARPHPEEQVGTSSKPVDEGEASASTNPAEGAVGELTTLMTRLQELEQQHQRSDKVVQSLDPCWKTRHPNLNFEARLAEVFQSVRLDTKGCVLPWDDSRRL